MLIVWLLLISILIYVWYNSKYGARNAALKKIPSPKKRFFFHNALDLVWLDLIEKTEIMERWHREFGEVFHFTLNPFDCGQVLIMDPKIAEAVSLHQPDRFKSKTYQSLSRWIGSNGFLLGRENEGKSRLKCVFKFFNPINYEKQHMKNINEITDGFVLKLKECNKIKQELDIFFLAKCFALDLTFKSIFNIDLETKNGKNLKYLEATDRFAHFGMRETLGATQGFEFIHRLTDVYREEAKALKILHDFTMNIVKDGRKRLAEDRVPEGFFILYSFLTSEFDGRLLTDEEVRAEMDSSVLGSHDTTKTSLAFAIYNIAKHPDVQKKVYEEAKEVLNDDARKFISYDEIDKFPYIESVLKESLRLYAPLPFAGRKLKTEVTVEGYTFPKNTEIIISPYLMGRSATYFTDPLTFNPERFLGVDTLPYGFNPFSVGARKCIGGKFGMTVLKVAIAKFIYNFQVSLAVQDDFRFYSEFVLVPDKKVMLDFERRTLHP